MQRWHMDDRGRRLLGLATVLAVLPVAAWAHTVSLDGDAALARGFNLSVVFLLSMPVAIVAVLFGTVYLMQKRARGRDVRGWPRRRRCVHTVSPRGRCGRCSLPSFSTNTISQGRHEAVPRSHPVRCGDASPAAETWSAGARATACGTRATALCRGSMPPAISRDVRHQNAGHTNSPLTVSRPLWPL